MALSLRPLPCQLDRGLDAALFPLALDPRFLSDRQPSHRADVLALPLQLPASLRAESRPSSNLRRCGCDDPVRTAPDCAASSMARRGTGRIQMVVAIRNASRRVIKTYTHPRTPFGVASRLAAHGETKALRRVADSRREGDACAGSRDTLRGLDSRSLGMGACQQCGERPSASVRVPDTATRGAGARADRGPYHGFRTTATRRSRGGFHQGIRRKTALGNSLSQPWCPRHIGSAKRLSLTAISGSMVGRRACSTYSAPEIAGPCEALAKLKDRASATSEKHDTTRAHRARRDGSQLDLPHVS
jgi:hypothetical protein